MPVERRCRVGVLIFVSIWMLCFSGAWSWGGVDQRPPAPIWIAPYFPVPDRAELCGEVAPLHNSEVRERFDREFTIVSHSQAQVYLWLKRKERYFPMIEKQLSSRGLPDDLKYLAVAESDLMSSAVSHAGAAGPWQFMATTATNYGMNQSPAIDERYDFEKAASAALNYLKDLHGNFQNWTLAVAAYNCGERRVQDEIRRQKNNNYYFLKLPQETERYVMRILAIKEVLANPEKYGFYLPRGAAYKPIIAEKVNINIPGPMPIIVAAESAGISYRELKVLNPSLVSDVIPRGSFTMRVPEGKGKEFEKKVDVWKATCKPGIIVHKVAKGETLDAIARKYNSTCEEICGWNKVAKNKIRVGQTLKIYR